MVASPGVVAGGVDPSSWRCGKVSCPSNSTRVPGAKRVLPSGTLFSGGCRRGWKWHRLVMAGRKRRWNSRRPQVSSVAVRLVAGSINLLSAAQPQARKGQNPSATSHLKLAKSMCDKQAKTAPLMQKTKALPAALQQKLATFEDPGMGSGNRHKNRSRCKGPPHENPRLWLFGVTRRPTRVLEFQVPGCLRGLRPLGVLRSHPLALALRLLGSWGPLVWLFEQSPTASGMLGSALLAVCGHS